MFSVRILAPEAEHSATAGVLSAFAAALAAVAAIVVACLENIDEFILRLAFLEGGGSLKNETGIYN